MRTTTRLLGLGVGTTLTAAALMGTLGGCGLADGGITVVGANPGSVTVPISVVAQSTVAAQSAHAAAVAAADAATVGVCAAAELRLAVTAESVTSAASTPGTDSGDAQTRRQRLSLVFTNVSGSTCFLRGYPSVDFLRDGAQGPLSEPDTFSGATPVTPATRVELAPGGEATATVSFVTNGAGNTSGSRCNDAVAVRAFLPGSAVAIDSGVRNPDSRGPDVRSPEGTALGHFYVCGHGVVVEALRP